MDGLEWKALLQWMIGGYTIFGNTHFNTVDSLMVQNSAGHFHLGGIGI